MAKLFFKYGAMNSGKSTALLQAAHNYEERGMRVLIVKPKIDRKGEKNIVARLGVQREVDILADSKMNLREIILDRTASSKIACVLIDEAQFLTTKQIDQLFELAVLDNTPVLCFGLRTDFQTKLFPGSERLLAMAHSLEELKTICRCGKKATLVGRLVNGVFTFKGSQVAIDGKHEITYESMCGACYFSEKSNR